MAFFDSCKDVKFGATNGFVMDLIGGGASSWIAFLEYMGHERPGLGSPFQIDFPSDTDLMDKSPFIPLNPPSLRCDSNSLDARCACADCPSVCTALPPAPAPFIPPSNLSSVCRIGQVDCLDFACVLIYALALFASLLRLISSHLIRSRKHALASRRNGDADSGYETPSGYERVSMHDPLAPNAPNVGHDSGSEFEDERENRPSARSINPLVGATSMADTPDRLLSRSQPSSSPTTPSFFSVHHRHRGGWTGIPFSSAPEADARLMGIHHQPRSYPLNVILSRIFYRLGFRCAAKPYITISLALVVCAALNMGWSKFQIEKDPSKLWVSRTSTSAIEKADFEARFGPFYRTEQIFLSPGNELETRALTFERLQWIAQFEADIRALKSPSGLSLASVCLAPLSPAQPPTSASDCVVQSIMGYFGNSLEDISSSNWAQRLDACATSPANCPPAFGQPLDPHLILGGIPAPQNSTRPTLPASQARAVIITYVVNNYLESVSLHQAQEWEAVLKQHLEQISNGLAPPHKCPQSVGLKMAWSTEISLEGEINQSTNTDIPIVIMSYLAMFLYVAINLGGSASAIISACIRGVTSLVKLAIPNILRFRSPEERVFSSTRPSQTSPSLKRQLLVESKFMLALWSILIVLLSVSTSIGLFSMLGVKTTLIIAEVIPFLVLAIGVDNVFLLSNELSRQNSRAYIALARSGVGFHEPNVRFDEDDPDDEIDGLPRVETRIAKALSRMGPSVLLSASCETVAFALGAIVGMPAVRNFAIYAAGAVVINTFLQMTIFVSAMAIDLHRMEVCSF